MAKTKARNRRKKQRVTHKPGEWKAIFTGRMVMCLNAETLDEMRARSRFEGHWNTRINAIIKHRRLYRINVYTYGVDGDLEHDVAQLIECGSMEEIWHIVHDIVHGVAKANPDVEIDQARTIATVKA